MSKIFNIRGEDIVRLVPHSGGCLATDRITVDGCEISYFYREETNRTQIQDGDFLRVTSRLSISATQAILVFMPSTP
jgi:hypothetical protein